MLQAGQPKKEAVINTATANINARWRSLAELTRLRLPAEALRDADGNVPSLAAFRKNPAKYIIALLDRVASKQMIHYKWARPVQWPAVLGIREWGFAALTLKWVPYLDGHPVELPSRQLQGLCIPYTPHKSFKKPYHRKFRPNVTKHFDGYLTINIGELARRWPEACCGGMQRLQLLLRLWV